MSQQALALSLMIAVTNGGGEGISQRARTRSYQYLVTLGLLVVCGLCLFGCAAHRPKEQTPDSADTRAARPRAQQLPERPISPPGVVASEPRWSPEGSMIAFRVWKMTGAVMQAAGFMLIEVATGKVLGEAPGITFDWCGENVLLWQDGDIQRMDVRTGRSRRSQIKGIGPICSASGHKIAVQRDSSRRVLVVVDQSRARTAVVTRATEEHESFTYEWSPSARYLAVADWKPEGLSVRREWVRIFTAEGRFVCAVPRSIHTTSAGHLVSWTPDEAEVVYACRTPTGFAVSALRLDRTRPPRILVRLPEREIWGVRVSPNGQWLTYSAGSAPVADLQTRRGRIYLRNLATGRTSALAKSDEPDLSGYGAVWSADSRYLAYVAGSVVSAGGVVYVIRVGARER
jgi:hypothetical protein